MQNSNEFTSKINNDLSNLTDLASQNEYLQRVIQTQAVTNELLQTSLVEPSLNKMLEMAIDHVVSAPMFSFKSKGAILLVENEPGVLVLKAHRGLSEFLLTACARVPFGKCLCGKAAQAQKIVYADCVDDRHDITYSGIPPHGHYCVPILSGTELLGVITLYVEEGHRFNIKEHSFLQTIADVLSGMIQRRKSEADLTLAQLKLLQSDKLAAIGQLSTSIAHEINSPIGFIGTNLECLKQYLDTFLKLMRMTESLTNYIEHKNTADTAKTIENIKALRDKENIAFIASDMHSLLEQSKDGIDRIKRIVLDLKTFSHNKETIAEAIDLEKTLESVLRIVWGEIKYKAEVKKEYEKIPSIPGDSQKLGQVFINILINAAQAIPKKGIITLKTFARDNSIGASISDTGSGISEETQKKIFDPFFTTKPVGLGTGLGLSICQDIITKMGGTITVTSEIGKGTTFTILLPLQPKTLSPVTTA